MWYNVVSKFIWRLKIEKSLTSHFLMTLVAKPNLCHESPCLSSFIILSEIASSQIMEKIMTIRKYFLQSPSSLPISVILHSCKYSGKNYFLITKSNICKSVLLNKCLSSLELNCFFLEAFCPVVLSDFTLYFSPTFLAFFSSFLFCFCLYK